MKFKGIYIRVSDEDLAAIDAAAELVASGKPPEHGGHRGHRSEAVRRIPLLLEWLRAAYGPKTPEVLAKIRRGELP